MNTLSNAEHGAPSLAIIVPTRNEEANVRALLDRVAAIDFDALMEVIFVDDSDDGTPAEVRASASDYEFDVRLIHRPPGERQGGLGGAVVAGIEASRATFACVMDGDLQHPPERIPFMYDVAVGTPADLVVGTRFRGAGAADGLSGPRKAVSKLASLSARTMFPRRSRGISDPMSGFFLVRRSRLNLRRVHADGFKILLEIAATHPDLWRAEVPYTFGQRHAGETKASFAEGIRFLTKLASLRVHPTVHRYLYDIHGIIAVDADAWLPELESFRVEELDRPSDITVRQGLNRDPAVDSIDYREMFGRLGFAIRIERATNETTISVSRLVAMSPHVLYTNAVEPVLRWMFAERGYALVHAACIERDGAAHFITARTDTGKTTTMLKVLDGTDFRFVSDDLTIVSPDGRVLPYPKPLTISAHTLHAVKRNRLTWKQRMGMPIQSRLHSKSGRTVGFALADATLPAATMNAIVQKLIPPPKYHIDELVPTVEIADEARVERLFIIERDGEGEVALEESEAMDILMANCEDAYGFPPYHDIEPYLRDGNGQGDLADLERSTISSAFSGVPTVLLRSRTLDWAERIPALVGTSEPTGAKDRGEAAANGNGNGNGRAEQFAANGDGHLGEFNVTVNGVHHANGNGNGSTVEAKRDVADDEVEVSVVE